MDALTGDKGKLKEEKANGPLLVVRQTEEDFAAWVKTEVGFLEMFGKLEEEPILLETYQRLFLNDKSRFRWVTKSRQVGFSMVVALEALARCHLRSTHTAIFVSYSADDAKEKIGLARQVYEDLPLKFQKKLMVDSRTELSFRSNTAQGKVSRILSHPSKAPRGKRGDVYLDELAHYVYDRQVYSGSTALILRSDSQMTGCSTPLGRRGIFWEIATEEVRKYPHYSRMVVPWWLCRFFCKDVVRAGKDASAMSTQDRVATFAKSSIEQQFEALVLEDFQQEFECSFLSESYAYFPYELILPNTSDDLVLHDDFETVPSPQGRIVAGFDVGRTSDRSELAAFEELGGRFFCRFLRTYNQVPFAEQEADLRRMLNTLPVARLSIDRSGIGMHLAENLAREFPHVVGENFTNESKERWATEFKILMQKRDVVLPRNRDLVGQIHSIKKKVLPSGKVSFDAERTTRGGHADKFWAIALACQKERGPSRPGTVKVGIRILGGDTDRSPGRWIGGG